MAEWTVKSVDGKPVEIAPTQKEQEAKEEVNTKQSDDALQEQQTKEVPVQEQTEPSGEVESEVRVEDPQEPSDKEAEAVEEVIELVESEDKPEPVMPQAPKEEPRVETQSEPMPEQIDKLVDFIKETGGSLEDFVKLNQNYDELKPVDLMREFYRQTKPHLSGSEVDFLMDEKFGFAKDADDRTKRSKEILWKEELYNAKKHLNSNKERYYADIKLNGPTNLSVEQKEALDFYNTHKEVQKTNEELKSVFLAKTDQVFEDFKGFDFKVDGKKYRYKVNDTESVKTYQKDLNNFIKEFLDDKGEMSDASGYHRALFVARNADKIAGHFYNQGKADAVKSAAEKAKNIDMSARADTTGKAEGMTVKHLTGASNKLKINLKNY